MTSGPEETPAGEDNREQFRISDVTLDENSFGSGHADIEQERKVAIFDLIEESYFRPRNSESGPYSLFLSIRESKLVFEISTGMQENYGTVILSLTPFRRIIKDYFLVCDSYFQAIRTLPPSQIEAIDMGRRGLHNEGSDKLRERLEDKIDLDHNTARRLFTLICVLHTKP